MDISNDVIFKRIFERRANKGLLISILYFILKHDDSLHRRNEYRARYALREQVTMEKLSDAMNLVFIELGRFKKSITEPENDKERLYFCLKHMAGFKQFYYVTE